MQDEREELVTRTLQSLNENEYGADYRDHYLTLYRDFVTSADTNSQRRNMANSFFLTVNTGFLGVKGYFEVSGSSADVLEFALVQAIVGMLFCLVWWLMIRSYRTLNRSKFEVIQMMEKNLPVAPYSAEWVAQKTGLDRHRGLSWVESFVPMLFGALHLAVWLSR
jgi:hypothetical protein